MAVASLTITYGRSLVVDYCSPFNLEQLGVLIKITSKHPTLISPWNFILLFDGYGWLAILISGVAATVCVYVVNVLTPVESARNKETMNSCIWFVYSVMVNQCCKSH